MSVVADTHALLWYLVSPDRLSPAAARAFDEAATSGEPVYVSVISWIETVYLVEKGRLPETVLNRLRESVLRPDSNVIVSPADLHVAECLSMIPQAPLGHGPAALRKSPGSSS